MRCIHYGKHLAQDDRCTDRPEETAGGTRRDTFVPREFEWEWEVLTVDALSF
jgi:hypothetical protein